MKEKMKYVIIYICGVMEAFMNNKQELLIDYLKGKIRPVTAKELSSYLDISVRTVKSYISYINNEFGETIIVSSTHGYELGNYIDSVVKQKAKNDIPLPQNYEERSNYINRAFLMRHVNKFNIFNLADELCVSWQTIKNDILHMNQSFQNFHIKYKIKGDFVYMIAQEKDIRKLAKFTLFDTSATGLINYTQLKDTFPDVDVEGLKEIIQDIFSKYDLYINDYSRANMLLHLSIIIRRIKNANSIQIENSNDFYFNTASFEYGAVIDLCERLERKFSIVLNEHERNNVYILFKTSANISLSSNAEDVYRYAGENLLQFIDEIIKKIADYYYIDLDNEKFIIAFILHLKNLIYRMQNDRIAVNPMCDSIRFSSPLIFDIAVFTGLMIEEKLHKKIDENEIAYIALHIGGEIDRQNITNEKMKVIVICPNYLEYETKTYNFLLLNFSNEIEIIGMVASIDEIGDKNIDFIITTLPIKRKDNTIEICEISLFQSSSDRMKIENMIERIKDKQSTKILHANFDNVFDERLFVIQKTSLEKEEVMKILTDKMIDMGYVDNDFLERVLERDQAMSTAFPNVAIPQSMKMDAIKTSICVMLCPEGIQWDDQRVYLVFTVAIHKADCMLFREIYESIIKLFHDEKNIRFIVTSSTFQVFRDKILKLSI